MFTGFDRFMLIWIFGYVLANQFLPFLISKVIK